MANWLQNSGMTKHDWISLGLGVGALVFGIGSALCGHKGNQVRANEINSMLDSRITQPPQMNNPGK